MRKTLIGLLALAALALPASASADGEPCHAPVCPNIGSIGGTSSLTVPDVAYGASGDCRFVPVKVGVHADEAVYYKFNYFSAYTGPTSVPDEVSGTHYSNGTFNEEFVICPEYDDPGDYTAFVEVRFYDASGNYVGAGHAADVFHIYPYRPTGLHTTKYKYGAHGWRVSGGAMIDGDVWPNHLVKFQRKWSGSWHTIQSKYTNEFGNFSFIKTPTSRVAKPYRVVSTGAPGAAGKVSRTYWLYRR